MARYHLCSFPSRWLRKQFYSLDRNREDRYEGKQAQLHRHTCSQEGGLRPQCLNPSVDQSPISQPLTPRNTFETVSPQPALPVGQTAKNCQCFAWLKSQSRGYFQLLIPLGPRASSLSHLSLLRAALGGLRGWNTTQIFPDLSPFCPG